MNQPIWAAYIRPIQTHMIFSKSIAKRIVPFVFATMALHAAPATTHSLNGEWEIGDSVSATSQPEDFSRRVEVPGLVNQSKPAFADVDRFESMEFIASKVRQKQLPESARIHTAGISGQERNYFWYRRTFRTPEESAVAMLRINKAQFGTAAWLNGQAVGENVACFSSSNFNLAKFIRWGSENEIVIRIGAHPGVLPVTFPAGTDFEKTKWTPGIYDSVSVRFCGNPFISSVQVAPRIATSEILVQTRIKNYGPAMKITLDQKASPWKAPAESAGTGALEVSLAEGEERVIEQTIPITGVRLWSPDDPFLYSLSTSTGGDEEGILIQNEFFIWTGAPKWDANYARHWDEKEMIRQFGDWMGDNWNHPSVVIWDATNESQDALFSEKVVPAVRGLDLSKRPWENSYNKPGAPDDAVESHPYLLQETATGDEVKFRFTDLETMRGVPHDAKPTAWYIPQEPHPVIINEYEWTWLNRDGSPTELTKKYYEKFFPGSTAGERFAWNAYVLAAETEFWRAHRHHAGVMYFVYLTGSFPGAFTSDNFLDVKTLKLEPYFADYVGESFKPLGVYLNFFGESLSAGSTREFTVMLVNDKNRAAKGELRLTFETESGGEIASVKAPFEMDAFGKTTASLKLAIPSATLDKCLLKATASAEGAGWEEPTISRRRVSLTAQ